MFGTDQAAGLFAFVWVRWPGVVDLVLRHVSPLDRAGAPWPEPDPKLMGFAPLTFGVALRHEKADGGRPMRSASYRMTDGAYSYSKLSSASRDYFFVAANPEDDDESIGVLFRLPT